MENINKLYGMVRDKEPFLALLSKEFDRSVSSIRSNWFSRGNVPDWAEKRVHELLINTLKQQKKKLEQTLKNQ